MAWDDYMPWNWGSSGSSVTADPTLFQGFAPSMSPGQSGIGGFVAPTADDPNTLTGQQTSGSGSGGMTWAGLSQGLSKLSEGLNKAGGSGSNTLQDSKSVASTVSGGVLSPQGAGGGASAMASLAANRNQLAQALIMAAMQGKGRGRSGGGLLG